MNKIKLAVAVAMLLASPALAQPSRPISDVNELSPPGVDHVGVPATALHWGMHALVWIWINERAATSGTCNTGRSRRFL